MRRNFTFFKKLIPSNFKRNIKDHLGVPSLSWTLSNLKTIGVSPKNVLDIGAYHGEWTIEFLSKFPQSNILMIEAQGSKMKRLEDISNKYENVKCYEALISSIDGETVTFFEDETASFASFQNIEKGVKKQTETVDTILNKIGFQSPDFIKIDIQGFELEALKGANASLSTAEFCLLECTVLNIGGAEPMLIDVLNFMNERNFQLYEISQIMRRPYDNAMYQLDVLFIRKKSSFISKKVW
jgi:FkbM family methyltransferase